MTVEDYSGGVNYQVPPEVLDAMMKVESGGNPNAVSPKGAAGAYQLMPKTAAAYGVNPMNPAQARGVAGAEMARLLNAYGGDMSKALAAYNWGQGNLDKNGAEKAPTETRNYVGKVADLLPEQLRTQLKGLPQDYNGPVGQLAQQSPLASAPPQPQGGRRTPPAYDPNIQSPTGVVQSAKTLLSRSVQLMGENLQETMDGIKASVIAAGDPFRPNTPLTDLISGKTRTSVGGPIGAINLASEYIHNAPKKSATDIALDALNIPLRVFSPTQQRAAQGITNLVGMPAQAAGQALLEQVGVSPQSAKMASNLAVGAMMFAMGGPLRGSAPTLDVNMSDRLFSLNNELTMVPSKWDAEIKTFNQKFPEYAGASATSRINDFLHGRPAHPVQDPMLKEELWYAGDHSIALSPKAKAIEEQHIKPIEEVNKWTREWMRDKVGDAYVGEDIQEPYQHLVTQKQFRERSAPLTTGGRDTRGLGTKPSSLHDRTTGSLEGESSGKAYYVIDQTGKNDVARVYRNNKVISTFSGNDLRSFLSNKEVTINGERFTRGQAAGAEIEENTPIRYVHDRYGAAILNNIELTKRYRQVQFMEEVKRSPEWKAKVAGPKETVPSEWRELNAPGWEGFRGYKFEPRTAHALEDYITANKGKNNLMYGVNRLLTGSLFWNPLPHIYNVLDHAIVEKGLVGGVVGAAKGIAKVVTLHPEDVLLFKAGKEVMQQGPLYRQYLSEGASLMLPNTLMHNYVARTFKALGTTPEGSLLAKAWGYANPVEMYQRWMSLSQKALWGANDIIGMQLLMAKNEHMEKLGLTGQEAMRASITEVNKHYPSYRIPTEIAGSRGLSRGLQNPYTFQFGRYDFNRVASYGHMFQDLVRGHDMRTRLQALDQMAMLTTMGMVVYPMLLDHVAQHITGNPNASWRRAGSGALPHMVYQTLTGDKAVDSIPFSLVSLSPIARIMIEGASNTQLWNRQPVFYPDKSMPQDIVNYIGQSFNPVWQLQQVETKKQTPGQLVAASIGIQSPTAASVAKRRAAIAREQKRPKFRGGQ